MNNPDEETAVAQFGRDDKYFGVCTMLVAMPGLPMFGHGQIEGFEEKYGMEYRRAYYNEQVNTGLVERHQREIFPLMRQRRLFSGVENFLLYDFRTDGQVNENVFAWSNVYGDSRSLILYNNKYEQTAGWINMSVAYAVKGSGDEKQLVQRTLAQGLLLTITSSRFVIFQEQHSKLWFIRKNSEIAERGLFAVLNGFETQVFLNIYEVTDTQDEQYRQLYEKLNGNGIADVGMGINEIKFKKLYDALAACVSKEMLQDCIQLVKDCKHTESPHETESKIHSFINKLEPLAVTFLTALEETYRSEQTAQFLEEKVPTVKTSIKQLSTLFKARMYRLLLSASGLLIREMPLTAMTPAVTVFIHKMCGTASQLFVSFGSVFLMSVEDIAIYYKMEENIGRLYAFLHLEEKLTALVRSRGFDIDPIENKADTVKYLYYVHNARGKKSIRRTGIVSRMVQDPNVIIRLGIHEWDGIKWFNREAAELLADDMAAMLFLSAARPVKQVECMKKTVDSVEKYCRFDAEFSAAIHRSGYQVDLYLKLFAGTLK